MQIHAIYDLDLELRNIFYCGHAFLVELETSDIEMYTSLEGDEIDDWIGELGFPMKQVGYLEDFKKHPPQAGYYAVIAYFEGTFDDSDILHYYYSESEMEAEGQLDALIMLYAVPPNDLPSSYPCRGNFKIVNCFSGDEFPVQFASREDAVVALAYRFKQFHKRIRKMDLNANTTFPEAIARSEAVWKYDTEKQKLAWKPTPIIDEGTIFYEPLA